MPKVFIISNMTHDYSNAKRFGELVNVTEGKTPIFKTNIIRDMLQEKLVDFTAEDFLLISGPTLLCIMAYQVILEKFQRDNISKIKLLVFDAKDQDYIVRHLSAVPETLQVD